MGEWSTAVNPRHTQRTQGKGAVGDREPSGSLVGPSMSETWVILESHVDGGAGVGVNETAGCPGDGSRAGLLLPGLQALNLLGPAGGQQGWGH